MASPSYQFSKPSFHQYYYQLKHNSSQGQHFIFLPFPSGCLVVTLASVASSTNSDDKDKEMFWEDIILGMVNCLRLVSFFLELNTTTNSIIILLKGSTLSPCLFLPDVVTLLPMGCYQRKGCFGDR
jgi:hypothetical protein